MKVAGTLGNYLSQRVNTRTGELVDPAKKPEAKKEQSPSKSMVSDVSELESDCKSILDGIDPEKWKSMTKNQKKNFRKKLAHKRKKAGMKASQSGANSPPAMQEDYDV